MSLTELLLQAKSKKAEEFLFMVGAEPRARLASGWVSLRSSPGLVSEWNLLQQSLLSNQQKAVLDSKGAIQGETALESLRVGFSFYQDDITMKALVDLDLDGSKYEIAMPSAILDTSLRMKGLVLLSSPGEGRRQWFLQKLLQKMSEEKSFTGCVLSPKAFPQTKEAKGCFVYHDGQFVSADEREAFLSGIDMVVFDGFSDDSFLRALSLAEQGVFVVYSMKAPSIANALLRCLSVLSRDGGVQGPARFAEVLSLVAGVYGMSGLSGEKVFAHEVLLLNSQVRSILEAGNIKGLDDVLNQASENSGMLNLNQSLLQHLIRRRVDLRTAFEVSRDPDGLDQLLKKVGI